jgi:hypothetical protein
LALQRLTESKGNLANHPVIALVYTNSPNNQANSGENGCGIDQPQSHLRCFLVSIALAKLDHYPVAQSAREEEF